MSRPRRRVRAVVLAALAVVSSLILAGSPAAAASPPLNNDWAAAAGVGPLPATKSGDTTHATKETNEPDAVCNSNERTIWYKIRAASDMVLSVDTFGSAIDTGVTVWKGSSPETLVEVACSYGSTGDPDQLQGRAAFRAKAGVLYFIQINTQADNGGPVTLHVKRVTPPVNDQFADARSIALPFETTINNAKATTQSGEPADGPCLEMRATRWYRFKSQETVTVRADTLGTEIDTMLAVFRGGPALGDLEYLACDDDTSFQNEFVYQSSVTWVAKAGRTYWLQVGSYDNETGPIDLAVRRVQRPPHDDRGFALIVPDVTSEPFSRDTSTRNATAQNGETLTSPCASGDGALYPQSIWYRYTAPSASPLTVTISGDEGVQPVVVVYTGSSFATDTVVECTTNELTFTPVTGTTYFFQVAGVHGRSGPTSFGLHSGSP